MREISRALGVRLHRLRKTEGLTLMELAQRSGVNIATLSRLERGRRPGPVRVYLRLAAAFGLRLAKFVEGIEEVVAGGKVNVAQPPAWSQPVSVCHEAQQSTIRFLTTQVLTKKLMPALVTILPGGCTPTQAAKLGTEGFL